MMKDLTEKSIAELTLAAEQGDAGAQYQLAEIYAEESEGEEDEESEKEAAKWYRKAAEQENEEAADRLNELNSPSVGPFFKRLFGL